MHRTHVIRWLAVVIVLTVPPAVRAFEQDTASGTRGRVDRVVSSGDSAQVTTVVENSLRVGCTLREFLYKEIGLSQEQASKMRGVTAESMQRIKKARIATKRINEEKVNMFLCGRVDRERLEMLDREYLKYYTQLLAERLKMQRERVAILTEDQVKRLGSFLAAKRVEAGSRKASK